MSIQCNKFSTYIHWNLINIILFFAWSQSSTWSGSDWWGWLGCGISICIPPSRRRRSLSRSILFRLAILLLRSSNRSVLIWSVSICAIWYGSRQSTRWRWCISCGTDFFGRGLRRSKRWRTTVLSFSLVFTKSCGKIYFETRNLILF